MTAYHVTRENRYTFSEEEEEATVLQRNNIKQTMFMYPLVSRKRLRQEITINSPRPIIVSH